jgi:hypothetical protein
MSTQSERKLGEAEAQTNSKATPFSQLTCLLNLITTLNSDANLRSSFKRSYNASASESEPEITLLDSVAAILVQNHEIVAACYTSDTVSVVAQAAADDAVLPASDTDVDTDVDVDVNVSSDTFSSLQLAALANPDFKDTKSLGSNQNPHKVQILAEGKDLWEMVKGTPRGWYFAFM